MSPLKDNFINIPFTVKNLDRYIVRISIFKALKNNLSKFSGRLLDAGCGKMPYREYILDNSNVHQYVGLDIESAKIYDKHVRPDVTWDGKLMPLQDAEFETVFATEVLEHCPDPEDFLNEVYRVLKPQGIFFFTVPFLWNLHEVPNDEYRYTPFSLERHLRNCKFSEISIHATGGWHASLAQLLGLWVRRAPINRVMRAILSVFFMPLIRLLMRLDTGKEIHFKEGTMITGLYGLAKKN